jgi:hypothetical protein
MHPLRKRNTRQERRHVRADTAARPYTEILSQTVARKRVRTNVKAKRYLLTINKNDAPRIRRVKSNRIVSIKLCI